MGPESKATTSIKYVRAKQNKNNKGRKRSVIFSMNNYLIDYKSVEQMRIDYRLGGIRVGETPS